MADVLEILDPLPEAGSRREHDVRSATAKPVSCAREPEIAIMDALPAGLSTERRQRLADDILLALDAAGWRFASKTDERLRVSFRTRPAAEGGEL
ncbi:hypothetical protein [Methylopila sp. M107]|uniref:hypothetical protein n=1 Tax=Methylopila sp. M107 TaxID=1101190 RepID=UPI0003760D1B|nr:hypothetical protein [Methylopila sp. M107]